MVFNSAFKGLSDAKQKFTLQPAKKAHGGE